MIGRYASVVSACRHTGPEHTAGYKLISVPATMALDIVTDNVNAVQQGRRGNDNMNSNTPLLCDRCNKRQHLGYVTAVTRDSTWVM